MTKLDAAYALALKGFKVFPIAPGKKAPPLLNGWPLKATDSPIDLNLLWEAVPNANVGIHCAGLAVIDVDVKKGGEANLAMLMMTEGLPTTLTALTPSGGRHLFYRLPDGHAGVPNRVDVLGRGLDIRSTGGYVVAAGSVTEAGEYRWDDPATPIADAPDWLTLRLGANALKASQNTSAAPVPDAADAVLDRARDWLAGQPGAVEGQGGDARTFTVCCGLRDMGVSSVQALDLLTEWNARCEPPWLPEELGAKVRNAYNYGQNAPAARAALPEDFPIVQRSVQVAQVSAVRHAASRLSQFASSEQRSAGYLIKGLLQRASYAELFGEPGAGKTFVALDLAYHAAAGRPWMERRVHSGVTLYLAYEGTGGLVKRAQALCQKYGKDDVPLYIMGAAFNLREPKGRAALGEVLAGLPAKPVLIVIDTFARALMGGDENSAQDVGAFNSAVAALIESTGACVLLIHHSGKNKSAGARGSSALLGAIDTELQVDDNQVIARKQRDVEVGPPMGFRLIPVVVGVDTDGDEVTSCVVEPEKALPPPRIAGNQKRAFDLLCELRPDNAPISEEEWRQGCGAFLGERANRRTFYDILRHLRTKGYVVVEDGNVTRRMR